MTEDTQALALSSTSNEVEVLPIFFSQNTIFDLFVGEAASRFGLLNSNYSNHCFEGEGISIEMFSHLTYLPEFRCNPLTLICWIVNTATKKKQKLRILYDNCSNLSILREQVSDDIDLKGYPVDFDFTGTGGNSHSYVNQKDVRFVLMSLDGKFTTDEIQAVTLPKVTNGFERILVNPDNYDYLKGINDFTEKLPMTRKQYAKFGEIDLLIGMPYESYYGTQSKTLGKCISDPIACHTKLGSCISASIDPLLAGTVHATSNQTFNVDADGNITTNPSEFPDLTQFMRLDVIGIKDFPDENNEFTFEENEARNLIKEGTTYCPVKKEYTTVLPWRDGKIEESNRDRALATTHAWVRKLRQKDPGMIDGWINAYDEMVKFGFVEKVPVEDERKLKGFHYIQSFPIAQPHKPTHPVRLVFAANQKMAKSNLSLNQHLYTGPNNLKDLVKLVLRFRMFPFVFNLDISRMFHRTKLNPEDSEYLRFFLVKKDDVGDIKFESYRCNSICFGLSCSPFICTFLLQQHAEKYLEREDLAEAARQILNNAYMDDVIVGHYEEAGLIKAVQKVKMILEDASLPSYKYVSNSKKALDEFPKEHISTKEKVSMLGTIWTPALDKLTFNLIKSPLSNVTSEPTLEEAWHSDQHATGEQVNSPGSTCPVSQDISIEMPKKLLTMRMLLSTIAKIFDSQGLVSPFVLIPKILMQSCWEKKLPWDEKLPDDLHTEFESFLEELPRLEDITISRCILPTPKSKITEICSFADASARAYACVVYAVATDEKGLKKASLVFSKTRMRPLGKTNQKLDEHMSICRLELMAAVIAARAGRFVHSAFPEFKEAKLRFFSDSQVTLCRLQNDYQIYRVFVANRLKSILEITDVEDWYYVTTLQNASADAASRGRRLEEFIRSKAWWEGPSFLIDPDHDYEKMKIKNIQISKENRMLESGERKVTTPYFSQHIFHRTEASTSSTHNYFNHQLRLLDPVEKKAFDTEFIKFYMEQNADQGSNSGLLQRFRSWSKLVRVVARIFQFVDAVKSGWAKKLSHKPRKCKLNLHFDQNITRSHAAASKAFKDNFVLRADFENAENFLFRVAQYLSLEEELWDLKSGGSVEKSSSIYKLRPFWDTQDCLIRMSGRLPSSDLILLPRKNRVSELYATYLHVINNHAGTNVLASRLERRCYLIGGKHEYKRIVRCCVCRKHRPLHQEMAKLPRIRCATSTQSHYYIAMDYAGPFYVYDGPKKKERKCYTLIITCLVTRHIHVELVEDCTTLALIQAIRAYVAIHGQFLKCWSDNASYFKGADRELRGILEKIKWDKVKEEVNAKQAEWNWFCPLASAQAGVIESCVKLFKTALKKALSFTYRTHKTPRYFSFSEFRVVCLEIASLVNDRPLSVISSDKEGLSDEVNVTPNLLCRGRDGGLLPTNMSLKVAIGDGAVDVNKVYRDRTKVLRLFWNEFIATYQRKLKLTPKWFQKFEHDIPINSYVLLKEKLIKNKPAAKPGTYVSARVVGVHRRKNGLISRLDLKTTQHKGIIQRDIRDCSMTEHDYLNITEKNHNCLLQDTKLPGDKASIQIPINEVMHTHILNKHQDWSVRLDKRGQESVFSMSTYFPKSSVNLENGLPDLTAGRSLKSSGTSHLN